MPRPKFLIWILTAALLLCLPLTPGFSWPSFLDFAKESPRPAAAQAEVEPAPAFLDALWVATSGDLLKLALGDGALLVRQPQAPATLAVAVDEEEARVWTFGEDGTLQVLGFDGAPRGNAKFPQHTGDTAVHLAAGRGFAWLAFKDVVYQVDGQGQILATIPVTRGLRAVAFDPTLPGVWIANLRELMSFGLDGQPLSSLGLGNSVQIADLAVERSSGELWVALSNAVRRYGADLAELFEVPLAQVRAVDSDGQDGAWVALQREVVLLGADGTVRSRVTLPVGGGSANLLTVAADPTGAAAWALSSDFLFQISPQGQIVRTLRLKDFGADTQGRDLAVYADLVAPEISFTAPADGATVSQNRPTLELAWSDRGIGVDPDSLEITANGAALAVTCEATATGASCIPDQPLSGVVTLSATVADFVGNRSAADTITITITIATGLDLRPLTDQTVVLGSEVQIALQVTGGSGPLSFSVAPLPLPEGAKLNGTAGVFSFLPTGAGVHTLTFSATDGVSADSESVTITVQAPAPGTPTSIRGRVLDTNDAVRGIETPIVGARVSLLRFAAAALTDANGYFELANIPGGDQVIDFDTKPANPAPDGSIYAGFREKIFLRAGTANVISRAFYLPRIDPAGLTTVNPAATTLVHNPNLNVTLIVPPNTAKNQNGTNFTGQLSMSEVPASLAPVAMPEELAPSLLLTAQPVGVTFSQPVRLTIPNVDGMPPGSELDLWSVDPSTGQFSISGVGRVSADGSVVETISGGIRAATWHAFMGPQPGSDGSDNNNDNQDPDRCDDCNAGSQTALMSGNVSISHDLAPYFSLNRARSLRLVYNSNQAAPQPVLSSRTTVLARAAVPSRVSAGLEVGGVDHGTRFTTNTSSLSESVNETFLQSVQLDGMDMPTGLYPYRMRLSSHYTSQTVSSFQSGKVIVHNLKDSPVGAGWGVAGLTRIHPQPDASVLVTGGNGSAQVFQPAPVDLRTWRREGPASAGNWTVAADGLSVLQTINGNPTFFVSPADMIDTVIRGRFRVETTSDDDFIGFVIGYRSPIAAEGDDPSTYDFVLFDWKQGNQSSNGFQAFEGFALSRVNGRITNLDPGFWGHTNSTGFQLLASDWGTGRGWRDQVEYEFELSYFRDRIRIAIDGRTIFDLPGSFQPGRFGFYNYSQEQVRYRSFTTAEGFVSPPGDFTSLVRNPDGTYVRTYKDGSFHRFDAEGRLTAAVDTTGDTTAYSYDAAGRLTAVTDPAGLQTVLTYSGNHLASVTDPSGRTTRFDHDSAGNLIRITDADGSARNFSYDGRHRLTGQRSKRGFDTTYSYNFAGQNDRVVRSDSSVRTLTPKVSVGLFAAGTAGAPVVRPQAAMARYVDGRGNAVVHDTDRFGASVRTVDAGGRVTTAVRNQHGNPTRITSSNGSFQDFTYDGRGNLLSLRQTGSGGGGVQDLRLTYEPVRNRVTEIQDPAGQKLMIQYDAAGNPIRITDPLGGVTTSTYNARGQVVTTTDAHGHTTRFTYDAAGNTETLTDARGVVTRFTRDAVGRVVAITEAAGLPEERTRRYSFDAMNRTLSAADPAGGAVLYTYDADSNLIATTSPTGEVFSRNYDSLQRITRWDDPAQGVTQLTYDANGNVTTLLDSKGARTAFEYDVNNRLVRTVDALNGERRMTYDARGNMVDFRNALGRSWTLAYDSLDRLTRQTDPLGRSTTFTYDSRNLLTGSVDAASRAFSFVYDALGRAVEVRTPDNTLRTTYDAAGNVTAMEDNDSRLVFAYDAAHRPIQTEIVDVGVQPGAVLDATFDAVANRTRLADSAGGVTTWTYDDIGRMTGLTTPGGKPIALGYDARGRFTDISFPNGLSLDYDYNAQGKLSALHYRDGSGAALSSFTYLYDVLGKLITVAEGARVREYSYDALERLVNGGTAGLPETYSYDAVGNRLSSQLSAAYRYDAANQLLEDDRFTYQYDVVGNLIAKTEKSTGAATGYQYDAQHQLTRIDFPDGSSATYRYDVMGRRIEKSVNGLVTRYIYDGLNILLEYDGNDNFVARYSHGPGLDRPLALERGGQSYFYLTDHQGSVRFLTGESGATVNRYEYDSFGRLLVKDEGVPNPFTYTGRELDEKSGLYFHRSRYYDPEVGRFITRDPLGLGGGDPTFYAYGGGDPVNRTDPSGLGWDIVDVGFFLWSLYDFIECPSLENGLGLALDTISLLPIIPSLGWATRADDVLDAVNHADDVGDALRHSDDVTDVANHADDLVNRGDDVVDSTRVPCRCFTPETEVLTETGKKPIVDLHLGDRVWARDEESGEESLREVIGVFERDAREILTLGFEGSTIETTDSHRLWVDGEGWKEAGSLKVGDRILGRHGEILTLKALDRRNGRFTVYDIQVEGLHSYFTAKDGVLAHNCDPTIKPGSSGGDTAGERFPEDVRQQAFDEDPSRTCVYCGQEGTGTQVDHAVPRANGGNATLDNAQLACPHCNASKGARDYPVTPPADYEGAWPPPWWPNQ